MANQTGQGLCFWGEDPTRYGINYRTDLFEGMYPTQYLRSSRGIIFSSSKWSFIPRLDDRRQLRRKPAAPTRTPHADHCVVSAGEQSTRREYPPRIRTAAPWFKGKTIRRARSTARSFHEPRGYCDEAAVNLQSSIS